jgi:hypothetical protein
MVLIMENDKKIDENTKNQLIFFFSDYLRLKEYEKRKKKLQSDRNKRYYQRHKEEILKKNKEMRDIYKIVKQK